MCSSSYKLPTFELHQFWEKNQYMHSDLETLNPEKDEDEHGGGKDFVNSIVFWNFTSFYKVIWFSGLLKQHLQPYLGWKHDISFGNLVSDMVCILTVYFYEWHFSWLDPPREQQAQTRN